MKALRLMDWKSSPELVEVADPTPGPGEVVVRIGGAGACHSDLHLMHDFEPGLLPWNPPFTLGHENAGWVHAVGDGVTRVQPGQAVAVYGPWGCGTCARCSLGIENYCENPLDAPVAGGGGGLGLDGGMAEYLLVPDARQVVPLPEGLEPVTAAGLTDAGLTPYHAINRSRHLLTPDATIVAIGVGGLGHVGVQIAKALGAAQVVAVDMKQEALDLAVAVGADHTVMSGESAADEIRALTGGRGADVVVDFVGATPTVELARAVARPMSDVTIVGIGGGDVPFSFFSQGYEVNLATTYWGTRPELVELLTLAARGVVRVEHTVYSLDDAAQAYVDLEAGKVRGRAVVVP
ncbi:MAG: NAD(P)-dependent alcohol dehydrogenase [Ilumatobacter sp.]|nr:NAD(P)-dependent alcohol dehydrogenase [Ilumatobacter sp.]